MKVSFGDRDRNFLLAAESGEAANNSTSPPAVSVIDRISHVASTVVNDLLILVVPCFYLIADDLRQLVSARLHKPGNSDLSLHGGCGVVRVK